MRSFDPVIAEAILLIVGIVKFFRHQTLQRFSLRLTGGGLYWKMRPNFRCRRCLLITGSCQICPISELPNEEMNKTINISRIFQTTHRQWTMFYYLFPISAVRVSSLDMFVQHTNQYIPLRSTRSPSEECILRCLVGISLEQR